MVLLPQEERFNSDGEITGTIFDIVYGLTGNGVCCKVMIKGCPLHCHDCQTPDDAMEDPEMTYYKSRCTRCGGNHGTQDSEQKGFSFNDSDRLSKHYTHFGESEWSYPTEKITSYTLTGMEIINEALNNSLLTSIMLTGGEPLTQPEFSLDLLKKAKKIGLSTIVDTTGYTDWAWLKKIIPYTDQFLFEIKLVDAQCHHLYAGFSNKQILDNLKKLRCAGCNVVIRYPILTGFNDDIDTALSIAGLAEECGVKNVSILTHPDNEHIRTSRINQLPRKNQLPEPSTDRTELLQTVFSMYCIDATIVA